MNRNNPSLTLFLLHVRGVHAWMYGGRPLFLQAGYWGLQPSQSHPLRLLYPSPSLNRSAVGSRREDKHVWWARAECVLVWRGGQAVRCVARVCHLGGMPALVRIPQLWIRVKVLLQFCPLLPHIISRWPFESSTRTRWWSIRFTQIVKHSHHTTYS